MELAIVQALPPRWLWGQPTVMYVKQQNQQLLSPSNNLTQCTQDGPSFKPSSVAGLVLVVLAQCAVLFLNRLQQCASNRCSLQSLILIQAGTQDTKYLFAASPSQTRLER